MRGERRRKLETLLTMKIDRGEGDILDLLLRKTVARPDQDHQAEWFLFCCADFRLDI